MVQLLFPNQILLDHPFTHLNQVLDDADDDVPGPGPGGACHVEDASLRVRHLSAQVKLGVGVDEAHNLRFLSNTTFASAFHGN